MADQTPDSSERGPVQPECGAIVIVGDRRFACGRPPHYADGEHRLGVVGHSTRGAEHPSRGDGLHEADVTLSWNVA